MHCHRTSAIVRFGIAALLFVLSILAARPAAAQVSGATLSGEVTDESGAAIAGCTISIKNVGTGDIREVPTNSDGFYTAPNLLPGNYEVTASATGFSTLVQKNVTLTVGAEQPLNLTLHVGNLSQQVVVSAAPSAVQTTTSEVSATVDSTTVREMPLNGRDWASLAALEPGVVSIPNQATTSFNANKGNRGFG